MPPDCPAAPDGAAAAALARLRAAGLRLTGPRRALVEALAKARRPLSAEDLHRGLGPARCDLVTVYRTLEALVGQSLVRRLHFGDGAALFEWGEAEEGHAGAGPAEEHGHHHHHHVLCRRCRRIEPLVGCPVEPLEAEVRRRGFADIEHIVEFTAICPACRSAEPAAAPPARAGASRPPLSGR